MANLFLDLPLPAGDGAGAAVDVSGLGSQKTFQVSGSYTGTVTIEASNDGGTTWVPVASFASPMGKRTLDVAAQFMRTRVANSVASLLPASVAVSSNDDGSSFTNLPATAGAGTGASADVSALGTLNTVIVTGSFSGSVIIEISDDGTDFVECMAFANPGFQTKRFTARFMRVTRRNLTSIAGLPIVNVGAINDVSGGGGGGGGGDTVSVSANDASESQLINKLVDGTVTFTELNDGSAETLRADVANLTLAQLNALVTDATLDDEGASRPPEGAAGGELSGTYPNPTVNDGADGSAIHDDTAGEIAAVAPKALPTTSDILLIEDAADGNNKKRITIGALPAGAASGLELLEDLTVRTATFSAAVGNLYTVDPAASMSVNLPAGASAGELVGVRHASRTTRTVTVDGAGGDTVEGRATRDVIPGEISVFMFDGSSNWRRIMTTGSVNIYESDAGDPQTQLTIWQRLSGSFQFNVGAVNSMRFAVNELDRFVIGPSSITISTFQPNGTATIGVPSDGFNGLYLDDRGSYTTDPVTDGVAETQPSVAGEVLFVATNAAGVRAVWAYDDNGQVRRVDGVSATYKLASPAPDSANASRLLSLTGAASPVLTLQTVHCKRPGHVTGLSCFIEPGIVTAGQTVTLNVEISTNGGATWNPLNAGVLIAGPINPGADRAVATFALDAANAFAANDLLRLEAAYTGAGPFSGDLSGEIEIAYT